MKILIAFIAGILIGVLLNGTNDTFIDSLRKWLNETAKNDKGRRAEFEDNIEKNLPEFRRWVKQEAERKRKLKRKLLLYCLLVLAVVLLFQSIEFSPDENKQISSVFQTNNKQQSALEKDSTTPEATVKATDR
ncbi:YtxH-like protein [Candidatus Electrothrix laxa]